LYNLLQVLVAFDGDASSGDLIRAEMFAKAWPTSGGMTPDMQLILRDTRE
jgi:hypothetical protein